MGNLAKGLPTGQTPPIGAPQQQTQIPFGQAAPMVGSADNPVDPNATDQQAALKAKLLGALGGVQSMFQGQDDQAKQALSTQPQMMPMNLPQIPQYQANKTTTLGPYASKRKY